MNIFFRWPAVETPFGPRHGYIDATTNCHVAHLIDGIVPARPGFNHSANYRSAMCFGIAEEITGAGAHSAALEHFVEHWFPGRWATLRAPTRKELAATWVIPLEIRAGTPIVEASTHLDLVRNDRQDAR